MLLFVCGMTIGSALTLLLHCCLLINDQDYWKEVDHGENKDD